MCTIALLKGLHASNSGGKLQVCFRFSLWLLEGYLQQNNMQRWRVQYLTDFADDKHKIRKTLWMSLILLHNNWRGITQPGIVLIIQTWMDLLLFAMKSQLSNPCNNNKQVNKPAKEIQWPKTKLGSNIIWAAQLHDSKDIQLELILILRVK